MQGSHRTNRRAAGCLVMLAVLAGCNGEIYLRDHVTDGDRFQISSQAAASPDPVTQSWIRYSLARSVCQLRMETDNPARASSFACERNARRHLAEAWNEHSDADRDLYDAYLNDLRFVHSSGYLDEYVAHFLGRRHWSLPADLDMRRFHRWRRRELKDHKPVTRIVGSWSYRAAPVEPGGS